MEIDIELIPWQQEVWADDSRFKVIAAGRRTGKSRLAAWTLIVNALQAKHGHVFYVAPTQGQARDIMWDMLLELGHSVITGSNINNLHIKLINGSTISLKGADRPQTMRGVSLKYLVMDEYADMKPETWEEILRPALSDQMGGAMFIGTPMGRNHFYDLYQSAVHAEEGSGIKAWHFTTYDNPIIPREEIAHAKRTLSSHAFKQEYMAEFKSRGSAMFSETWIKYGEEPTTGSWYIAADLAGFETKIKNKTRLLDDTAIACVKVNEDGWFVDNIISGRWELNETAIKIFEAVKKYRPVKVGIEKGIAQQAVMSPLTDLQKRSGRFFHIDLTTHGNAKKNDRIMWALQGRFENGFITLKKDDWNMKFLDQLFQFPDTMTHDDTVDALSYIDQLANVCYNNTIFEEDEWKPVDFVAGY